MKPFREKTKNLLNFDTSVESLEIDNEYNLFLWLVEKLRKIIKMNWFDSILYIFNKN